MENWFSASSGPTGATTGFGATVDTRLLPEFALYEGPSLLPQHHPNTIRIPDLFRLISIEAWDHHPVRNFYG